MRHDPGCVLTAGVSGLVVAAVVLGLLLALAVVVAAVYFVWPFFVDR